MRKKQILFCGAFLGMILLAGCGQDAASETASSDAASAAWQEATEQMTITLVNASNVYIKEVIFSVPEDENYEGYGALGEIDGMEPEDTYTASIPASDQTFQIEAYDEEWNPLYEGALQGTVEDGGVVVLLPEETDAQMIYAPGTDMQDAREEAVMAYSAEVADRQEETEKKEEAAENRKDAEKNSADQAARALGYDTVADMRFYTHTGYNWEEAHFYDLVGYWYPDGDANSWKYFAVDNRDNLRWFQFDEKEGDVETDVDSITGKILDTYTLHSGRKFTRDGDEIRFADEDVVYYKGTY